MESKITRKPGGVQAPPVNLAGLADDHLDSRIVNHISEIDKALESVGVSQRLAVGAAWKLGGCLNEKKRRLSHGKWDSWREESGIEERSAQDYMRLATQIRSAADLKQSIRETLKSLPKSEIVDYRQFVSLSAAFKSLPKPDTTPAAKPVKDTGEPSPLEKVKIDRDAEREGRRIAESELGNLRADGVEKDEQIAKMTEDPDSQAAAWHKRETESLGRVRLKLDENREALSSITKDRDYWKRRFRKLLKGVTNLEQTKAVVDLLAEYERAVVESPTARDHLEANADQILEEREN